ncbi:hypothetical protein FB45DRAFT_925014 [Roridomyces roridus]|uniref:F-box domain-containing protein n=1 Tax=Roridomyces roridus TaxID=1738132 RepID=A0AAD7FJU1_9AGAR|nr:hypothetical protein FB45DRAFT_925014 [Roridomyces roridus]
MAHSQNPPKTPLILPPEIWNRIIEIALTADPSFELFTRIACSCAQFRSFAAQHYFRHVILPNEKNHWNRFCSLLHSHESFTWVRSLRASSQTLIPAVNNPGAATSIALLTRLEELSVDLEAEGFVTQQPFLKLLCKHIHSSCQLTVLVLTSLPRIDIPLLRMIVESFPHLVELHLSSSERLDLHCWDCYQDSLELTLHSPIPDMFSDPKSMAIIFARILQPLIHLTHLHLGIFLSNEMLTLNHVVHGRREGGAAFGPDECILCDKAANAVELDELTAALEFAQRLKALRDVGFSSFFDRSSPDELSTVVYILREGGRIRVRKSPW